MMIDAGTPLEELIREILRLRPWVPEEKERRDVAVKELLKRLSSIFARVIDFLMRLGFPLAKATELARDGLYDAVVELMRKGGSWTWQGPGQFFVWIFTTACHKSIDAYRKLKDRGEVPIRPTREDDQDEEDAEYEDEIASDWPDPEVLYAEREDLLLFVEGLAMAAEQAGGGVVSETAKCLLLAIKVQINNVNPQVPKLVVVPYVGQIVEVDHLGNARQLSDQEIEGFSARTAEDLLDSAAMELLDFDGEDLWDFVGHRLRLIKVKNGKPDKSVLYARKKRYLRMVASLYVVPDSLRKAVNACWLSQMTKWVEDISGIVGLANAKLGALVGLTEKYLRWLFSQGHRFRRDWKLERILSSKIEELFKVNDLDHLEPRYPDNTGIQEFFSKHYPSEQACLRDLYDLRTALEHLKPQPKRLFTLLDLLKPQQK